MVAENPDMKRDRLEEKVVVAPGFEPGTSRM